mgnify:FL=1
MPKVFTYQKLDKLKSRKQTQFLFSKGQAITVFPIRLVYTIEIFDNTSSTTPSSNLLQAGVGAPSNTFKKAVLRNRVKRLLREAYRLEKPSFVNQAALENKKVNLFFLYTDTLVLPQAEIQAKVKEALALLLTKLKKA